MRSNLPTASFHDGKTVSALGIGTYQIGREGATVADGINAIRHAIDLGITLIDTAELYGEGDAEEIVGQAVKGRREDVFLVSKVHPRNASLDGTIAACERSLARLGVDQIDLYLLHWRGSHPLAETLEAFDRLKSSGKIARWGLSNFDLPEVEAHAIHPSAGGIAATQVLYNLLHRGPEFDLIPWSQKRQVPLMAYSPLDEGRLLQHPEVRRIARAHDMTPAQIAIAFVLARDNVIAIPKSSSVERVAENHRAAQLKLDPSVLLELDKAFSPPVSKVSLHLGW